MQAPTSPLSDVPITPNRRHTTGTVDTPHSDKHRNVVSPLINDDEAEKRQRRQSARAREEFNRRRSMLTSPLRQAQQAAEGTGGAAAVPSSRKKVQAIDVEIMAPLVPKLPSLTKEQMYVNYEEWMKMATDNKINANNSWNFALIDYFHEMTFLRDGDSINFQKASCTLDGCVKIYTSRVDSVASETGKLLSGLADSGGKDDRAADDEEDDDNGDGEKRTRRRAHRSEATLARDFSSLILKKLDTEFAVDPLFKKTSADFDEGGARGLLLNHLGVDRDCKIIFDAGDAKAEADEGEEEGGEQEEAEGQKGGKKRRRIEGNEEGEGEGEEERELEGEGMDVDEEKKEGVTEGGVEGEKADEAKEIDISKLKAKFLPSLQDIFTREICPTLKDFSFDSNAILDLPALRSSDPLEPDLPDLQNPANDDDDDLGDYFDENNSGFATGNAGDDGAAGVAISAAGPLSPIDPTVKPLNEKDYIMAGEENDMFSYFDSAFMRNWAGPEHWKMKRVVNKGDKSLIATGEPLDPVEGDDASAPAGGKKKRETFEIDFVNGEDLDEKVLFARAPGRANLTLPVLKEKESKYLLPDDMHFSSKQLLKFFQKPKFTMYTRRRANKEAPLPASLNEGEGEEADEQFWADQAEVAPNGTEGQADGNVDNANSANLDVAFPFADVDPDYDDDDPFGYVEHDGDDVPDLASAADAGGDSHGYGDNLIAASLRKVKPAYVNYAKTAKKVDVKKLKDNLWREMTVGAAAAPEDDVIMPEDDARVVGEQRFTKIMRGLERVYPEKKMRDISVPFCFICLLHLANEKNLKIENAGDESMRELIVVQDG